ncbi:extracellular solute-binding protein [Cellulomonas humilata]|uniref:Extracellular solute-binding protein n=2 Tax=Cellulomonas humilata TaxID=144055 RepID=A0A7Y6A3Q0_9CELL|nr:extracellular solute-binding protein [Cellulomonas humilata]
MALVAAGLVSVLVAGCSSPGEASADDPTTDGGPVALDFAWWGDTSRAERYEEAVALFEKENPNVDVRTRFAGWGDYWTARNTEAAGNSLPDVMQMDVAYLTEYATNGQIAALDDYLGAEIATDGLPESLLPAAQIDGETYAIPTSTNTLATIVNTDLLATLGVEPPASDATWDEYDEFLTDVATAGRSTTPVVYGSVDYTQILWLFQIWLGQQGKTLFEDDGLGFEKADLAQWWERAASLHENAVLLPPDRQTQLEGADALGVGETAADISWDNFLVRFSEGTDEGDLNLVPLPTDDPDERGLFLKPSLMLALSANSEHPAEAAALIDFLTNSPEVGEIFGMSRGVPASSAALAGFEPTGLDLQILEYEESLTPYLTNSPPPPVAGFGTLETAFVRISQDLSYGSMSVDQAVDEWFAEAESVLVQ